MRFSESMLQGNHIIVCLFCSCLFLFCVCFVFKYHYFRDIAQNKPNFGLGVFPQIASQNVNSQYNPVSGYM